MNHGIVDVVAFQEALLMEAIFGIALLAVIWAGFRRWLQYKEKMGRVIAEQTAERAAQYCAKVERVEARLKEIEQIVAQVVPPTQIEALRTNMVTSTKLDEARPDP